MKKMLDKNAPLVFGIILLIIGILWFSIPLLGSTIVTYISCLAMLLYGVSEIIRCFPSGEKRPSSHVSLINGIIISAISLMFLFTPKAFISILGILIAVWVLFNGIMRMMSSMSFKKVSDKNWVWIFVLGAGHILLGGIMLFNPLYGIIAIEYLIALAFLLQGISVIAVYVSSRIKR